MIDCMIDFEKSQSEGEDFSVSSDGHMMGSSDGGADMADWGAKVSGAGVQGASNDDEAEGAARLLSGADAQLTEVF